jgi:oxygen-independent coproporphyrinogen-3 oxidase
MKIWNTASSADLEKYSPEEVFKAGLRNHHISNTSYPIAHSTTWKPYKIARKDYQSTITRAFNGINNLCLYTHIPFCETRCYYCEYTVVGKDELSMTNKYMEYLGQELRRYSSFLNLKSRTLEGFDIGGGTPSFVEAEFIGEHIEQVRNTFTIRPGMEISIETTPKIASNEPEKIRAYKKFGIDRISMGIQVTQPDLLRILNRSENGLEHQYTAVQNIREAGFKKFNVDLMYGFAHQTLESWRATLEHAIKLDPEYITLYRMRYKLTRISDQASTVELQNVIEQGNLAKEMLRDHGYIANPGKNTFSKVAGDCGTSDYLTRRVIKGSPYLGIGLGAQTFTHSTISYNDGAAGKNLKPYFRSLDDQLIPIQDLYALPRQHMQAKMCAVSFYFGEVDLAAFQSIFGTPFEEAYKDEVAFLLKEGLMHYTGGNSAVKRVVSDTRAFSLTKKGAENFYGVIALFFAPSVKQYLINRDPNVAEDLEQNRLLAKRVYGE